MTPTTSTPAPAQVGRRATSGFTGDRFAAFLIWCLGVYLTYAGLSDLLINIPWHIAFGVAFGAQLLLTRLQAPIWRGGWRTLFLGGPRTVLALVSFFFDDALNAAGILPYARRIHETAPVKMLVDVGWVASGPIAPAYAILVAFVFGALIAGAVEVLWARN